MKLGVQASIAISAMKKSDAPQIELKSLWSFIVTIVLIVTMRGHGQPLRLEEQDIEVDQKAMAEERLSKRLWMLRNFDIILRHAQYHRDHKENFKLPRLVLWNVDDEENRLKLYVE